MSLNLPFYCSQFPILVNFLIALAAGYAQKYFISSESDAKVGDSNEDVKEVVKRWT